MSLSPNINDLEKAKFQEVAGEIAVRVSQVLTNGAKALGQPSRGRVTEVTLNSTTWTKVPPTPMPDRNTVSIQNVSDANVKTNWDNTVVGFVGMLMPSGSERSYEISDDSDLWAKADGDDIIVNVEEIG